jgi:DNA repair exonuclease SbcCD ATPase subunit
MSNQQTIRQLLTLDNRIKQLESLFQSANPNVSLASVSGVNPNELKVLKDEIEQLKKTSDGVNPNDLKVLKDEIEKLKKTPAPSNVNPNDLKVLKDEIEKLKKNNKEITDIDKMIKTNFDETNRKFEEVNKAVNSLDANLEKANKIEKDVEELKSKIK